MNKDFHKYYGMGWGFFFANIISKLAPASELGWWLIGCQFLCLVAMLVVAYCDRNKI